MKKNKKLSIGQKRLLNLLNEKGSLRLSGTGRTYNKNTVDNLIRMGLIDVEERTIGYTKELFMIKPN